MEFDEEFNHLSVVPKENRTNWGDFPAVISNGKLGDLKKEPEYLEAKSGDFNQSVKLVAKLLTDEIVYKIKTIIDNEKPIIVPILSEEATGRNRIPQAFAYALASRLELKVDDNIYQSNAVKRTDTGIYHRYVAPPEFLGNVKKGQSYLIVDDTLSVGGTITTLKGYIENQGGKVIAAAVMTAYDLEVDIAIKTSMIQSLEEKQGLNEYWLQEFGYGLNKLTQQEAGHLKKPTLEQIQERVYEARKLLIQNQEIQHEQPTQDTRAEQRQIHQAPAFDRATASGIDSLQQGRSGVFSKGISGTSQNKETADKLASYEEFKARLTPKQRAGFDVLKTSYEVKYKDNPEALRLALADLMEKAPNIPDNKLPEQPLETIEPKIQIQTPKQAENNQDLNK